MADRTLKRPMFRTGGSTNEGIMTGLVDRSGYAEGDVVKDKGNWKDQQSWWQDALDIPPAPYGEMTRDQAREYTYNFDSLGDAVDSSGRFLIDKSADFAGNFVANPLLSATNWALGTNIPVTPYNVAENRIDRMSGTKRDEEGNIIEEQGVTGVVRPGENEQGTKEGDTVIDTTKEVMVGQNSRESDVKAIYEDILPLLQSTMGVDDSEMNRQKYLELAKFGAGLMARPGGNLMGAIGKAAEQPLEGLSNIAEAKRKGNRAPAELAMKIALNETADGTLGKQIKDIKKLYPQKKGESVTEYNKRIGDIALRSGTATREATSEGRTANLAKVLTEKLDDEYAGAKAARAIAATGLDETYFEMWPGDKNKEEVIDGQYYIKKDGKLVVVKGKEVLTWNPQKQKFE